MRRDVGSVYVQMFDFGARQTWVGEPGSMCVHAETCGRQLALEHNGDLYSCDHFVEPRFKLGNIRELPMLDMVDVAAAARIRRGEAGHAHPVLPSTARCASRATAAAPRTASRRPRRRARAALPVRQLQGASSVTSTRPMEADGGPAPREYAPPRSWAAYAAEDAKRGRNDPCTCGSGRKWKACHGRESGIAAPHA